MSNEFNNASTLAHAVNDAATGERLTPHPYNRFAPDDSVWWLVPSTTWPSFEFAKFFFDSRPQDIPPGEAGIFCGISVEKGLSVKVKEFYPKELIHTVNWDWATFTTRLVAELPSLPRPQFVWLSLSYISPNDDVDSVDSFLRLKRQLKPIQAFFDVGPECKLTRRGEPDINDKCGEIADHFRAHIQTANTIPNLVAGLDSFEKSDWCWVDLYIGTVVKEKPVGKLWNDYLAPWSAWLRERHAATSGR